MSHEEFNKNYHIDHVIPLASFDMTISENQYKANNWTNCQHLYTHNNLSKKDKRIPWMNVIKDVKLFGFLKTLPSNQLNE